MEKHAGPTGSEEAWAAVGAENMGLLTRGGRGDPVWPGRPAPGLGRDKAERRGQTSLVSLWLKARSHDTRISNKGAELETVLLSPLSGLSLLLLPEPGRDEDADHGYRLGGGGTWVLSSAGVRLPSLRWG